MISFKNVSYSYPGASKKILDNLSFGIGKGDFSVIKGATGSGKSTILHLLTCQAMADAGDITVGPFEISAIKRRNIPEYRRSIGCVFQDFKLLEEKTVAENVSFALEVQRKFRTQLIYKKVHEILERVGVIEEKDHFPRELSEGGRQRTAIARALVTEPLVLFADAVEAQLDENSASGIFELLASENIRGMTILIATSTHRYFPLYPRSAHYFELRDGKVDEFLPVS